jgi:hypothetical protein
MEHNREAARPILHYLLVLFPLIIILLFPTAMISRVGSVEIWSKTRLVPFVTTDGSLLVQFILAVSILGKKRAEVTGTPSITVA